jgi:hypothetical protein
MLALVIQVDNKQNHPRKKNSEPREFINEV